MLDAEIVAAERSGEHFFDAELQRRRGRLLLQQPARDQSNAEIAFENALTVSRAQQTRAFELRALLDLARLWCDTGREREARDFLAPRSSASPKRRNCLRLQRLRACWPRSVGPTWSVERIAALRTRTSRPHESVFDPVLLAYDHGMIRAEAIDKLQRQATAVKARGATSLYLFGSTVRDEAHSGSDIDLFLDYDSAKKFSLFDLAGIKNLLEDELGIRIDVTTRDSLHPALRQQIERSAVRVF